MSGGFFRGTSADQDTRFSNKQAKLLKTQKFPSELDQLVDITKVKMDVMRPWIATRVTELLGFEDEVLINFIYGLLEGKVVDGKQIQIQLTGFMEKSTGKFMKELWNLLLSAQKNASGVPQQLLDSKEEEMRKKKEETDKLALEIQKRKGRGGWGPEVDRRSRMDDKAEVPDSSKTVNAHADSSARHLAEDDLDIDAKDSPDGRQNSRRKIRSSGSPYSAENCQSPRRRTLLAHRSPSRSNSNSRSYSGESRTSRSLSISPQRRRRSISHDRKFLSRGRPVSPQRPKPSMRWHSPRSRRRSTSRLHHRSPSLPRRRSPIRRKSRSPIRRRSRSPIRHRSRSPLRYRYPSPRYHHSRSPHRRSPIYSRRRSPIRSPLRHRSPIRSPLRHRSPIRSPLRHRSPIRSPLRHRSPIRYRPSLRHASPSPHSSPKRRRSPLLSPRRSCSPQKNGSPMHRSHRSPRKNVADPANRMGLKRAREDDSIPFSQHLSEREVKHAGFGHKREDNVAQTSTTSKSPQHNGKNRHVNRNSVTVKSYSEKASSPVNGREKKSRHTRESSLSLSPSRPARNQNITADGSEGIRTRGNESRHAREKKSNKADDSRHRTRHPTGDGDSKLYKDLSDAGSLSPDVRGRPHRIYGKSKGKICSSPSSGRGQEITSLPEEVEYGPGRVEDDIPLAGFSNENWQSNRGRASLHGRQKGHEHSPVKNLSVKDNDAEKSEFYKDDEYSPSQKLKKVERNDLNEDFDTDGEDNRKYKNRTVERKMPRVDDKDPSSEEAEYDSQLDHLKERKHRQKDEKKLRKEEKRRRRDERHRRKEERRASKQKAKYLDIGTPSDHQQNHDAATYSDDGARVDSMLDDNKETELEQKKLEIQLREKALESLRAKKAITN